MVIYDYSPTKVELQSHIQFFSGGRPNVPLGGGRSIQPSYWRIFNFKGGRPSVGKRSRFSYEAVALSTMLAGHLLNFSIWRTVCQSLFAQRRVPQHIFKKLLLYPTDLQLTSIQQNRSQNLSKGQSNQTQQSRQIRTLKALNVVNSNYYTTLIFKNQERWEIF